MNKHANKITAAVLSGLMMLSSGAYAVSGDTDSDGAVTAADAREALRVSVGLSEFAPFSARSADADDDGVITSADARLILRAGVGLESLNDKYYIDRTVSEDAGSSTICTYGRDGRLLTEEALSPSGSTVYRHVYRYSEKGMLMNIKSTVGLNTFDIKENKDGSFISSGRIPGMFITEKLYRPAPSYRLYEERIYTEKNTLIKIKEFDIFGRVSSVTDSEGTSRFTYEGSSYRISSAFYPDGRKCYYIYRDNGRLESFSVYGAGGLLCSFIFEPSTENEEISEAVKYGADIKGDLYMTVSYDEPGAENIRKISFLLRDDTGDIEFYPVVNYFYKKF